jgi:hypothetical protein
MRLAPYISFALFLMALSAADANKRGLTESDILEEKPESENKTERNGKSER